ncbi:grasp-with-spasm system SPASM domain peptide maturase [Roseivirga sp. BDSF3-8]|uniref:grasp-with-spasm system SPASM domain peptide maturase n=1 Tax=Roseivirga sp. BDSF3-8 TaxID=3241598 RepID=UPI003531CC97
MDDSKSVLLFSNCIPVKGASRSAICDLQRNSFQLIPNTLYDILHDYRGKNTKEIKSLYDNEYDNEIDEYFKFLIDNELAFTTLEPELFPSIDFSWKSPYKIENSIIDIDENSCHPFEKIFKELNDLGCKSVQLRYFTINITVDDLIEDLRPSLDSRIKHIDIIMPYSKGFDYNKLFEAHERINFLTVYSAPENKTIQKFDTPIFYTVEKISSSQHCGIVYPANFSINIDHFKEALHGNSCLLGKISVDIDGFIRNCPSTPYKSGHINEISLLDAVVDESLREFWLINKDQIAVCQDCEFRYICTDCRAFTIDNEKYAKPSKCSYDPYNAEWSNPSDNPFN